MLGGNMYSIPNPPAAPRKFLGTLFHWYRVVAVNGDPYGPGQQLRDLTLDGPDWPANLMANGTQMTIVSGVVGVFTTTVDLDP